ncbi:hypothetical protein C3L33_07166, partial [Rhododendron williamsianum]
MGNYKFRLSDMMPNAWFYKLRDMSKTRNPKASHRPIRKKLPPTNPTSHIPHSSHPRPSSYYYHIPEPTRSADNFYNSPRNPKYPDTQFPDFPRKSSSKKKHKRKTIYKPSPRLPTSSFPAHFSSSSEQSSPEFGPKKSHDSHSSNGSLPSWSSPCNCRITSSTTDIIIDINEESYSKTIENKKIDVFDQIPELQQLPPILTKPKVASASPGFDKDPMKIIKEDSIKAQKETRTSPRTRKSVSYSNGVKLRANSPRIGSRKLVQSCGRRSGSYGKRRSFSASLAVVKSSFDPQRDFRESMVEMIVENNIRASKDLEELLACYLSLNSDEYHDLIVKAFQQIWFDMAHLRL